MASFSDFMAQQQTAPSGSFSDFMSKKQPATSVGSDLKDAAVAYVGQTLHDANPLNAPAGLAQMIAHPTAGMSDFRDKAAQDWSKGNYLDAAQHGVAGVIPVLGPLFGRTIDAINAYGSGQGSASDVGTTAADLTAVKTVPSIYKGIGVVGGAAVDAAGKAGPIAKAVAPIVVDKAIKIALNSVPHARTLMDVWDMAKKVQKAVNTTTADTADVPASTIKTEIPTKFSADSVTETMGTKPPTAETPGAGLDDATHQRLTDSVATIKALPADAKAALTRAVKAGDDDAVHSILDRHTAVKNVNDAVNNKVAVLVKYAQDHGIDLSTITPEARQSFADAAFAHGGKNGMKVPKSGYRGISDDTMQMVQDGSKQPAVSTQPATTNSATDVKDAFASLAGGGITDALYAKLFKKLQNGDLTEAGAPSKFLKTVKPVFDSGLIKTPADLSAWAHSGAYKW